MNQPDTLLRCPRCKGQLGSERSSLICCACDKNYGIQPGVMSIYDLYFDDRSEDHGRDPALIWDVRTFEHCFKNIGYHENGVEFDKQLGYPEQVSRFHFERVKKRMVDWIQPAGGHCILDVGCGAGYFLYLIRQKYQTKGFTPIVTGVDISTFQLSYMARRMQKEGILDAVVVHANGEFLPFENESFDLVTCSEVLEHVHNPLRALSEMHRVLKPSGMLLLSTPSMMAEKSWTLVLAPLVALVKAVSRYRPNGKESEPEYDIPWYAKEFKQAIRSAQFDIQEFLYTGVIPHSYYFKFLPTPLIQPIVSGFEFIDRYLTFMLKPFAAHFIVRASKKTSKVSEHRV